MGRIKFNDWAKSEMKWKQKNIRRFYQLTYGYYIILDFGPACNVFFLVPIRISPLSSGNSCTYLVMMLGIIKGKKKQQTKQIKILFVYMQSIEF